MSLPLKYPIKDKSGQFLPSTWSYHAGDHGRYSQGHGSASLDTQVQFL